MCILYGDWLSGFCILVAYICCSQLADILSFWVVIFACSWAHKLRQFKFSRCRIWAQPVMHPCPMLISCIMCVKKMCCMMWSRGRWCSILKTECAAFALDPAEIQRKMEEVNIVMGQWGRRRVWSVRKKGRKYLLWLRKKVGGQDYSAERLRDPFS